MTQDQLRKAAMLWRTFGFDTLKIAEYLCVPESVIWNNMGLILRKCPAKKGAVS